VQALSTLLTMPHAEPTATSGCATHLSLPSSQVRPSSALQFAFVLCVGSHAPLSVVTCGWHVPLVAPTQIKPCWHGVALLQVLPCAAGASHRWLLLSQTSVWPQPSVAHDVPTTGSA
jgi:hypothetical protein